MFIKCYYKTYYKQILYSYYIYNMELVLEPDVYSPSIDENGNYIDKIPSFSLIKKGLLCPCGSRKDKIYDSRAIFSSHIKTQMHTKWLSYLNLNKANYYIENEKLNETIQNLYKKDIIVIVKRENDV